MYPIVLASTSPYRAEALKRLGLHFEQLAPDVDEDALKESGLAPKAVAEALALGQICGCGEASSRSHCHRQRPISGIRRPDSRQTRHCRTSRTTIGDDGG